jgi:N-acylneuraminate cytidylyltransferase
VRLLLGKPAIAYTIEAALESSLFHRVIVSTDAEDIARIARGCGAETPFIREPGLSDDFTPVSLVTVDALNHVDPDGTLYHSVAQLMANCPLRTCEDIRESYAQFVRTGADSQISVTRFGWLNPWWAFRRNPDCVLESIFPDQSASRSQDLPDLFCPTGAIWWANADALRHAKTFHIPGRTGWEINWQHAIDIDTEEDWEMGELMMEKRMLERSAGNVGRKKI